MKALDETSNTTDTMNEKLLQSVTFIDNKYITKENNDTTTTNLVVNISTTSTGSTSDDNNSSSSDANVSILSNTTTIPLVRPTDTTTDTTNSSPTSISTSTTTNNNNNKKNDDTTNTTTTQIQIVLFYKYFIPHNKYKLFYHYSSTSSSTCTTNYYIPKIKDYIMKLCIQLQLKGRILIAQEGINGTLASSLSTNNNNNNCTNSIDQFIQHMKLFNLRTDIPLPSSSLEEIRSFNQKNENQQQDQQQEHQEIHQDDHDSIIKEDCFLFENIDWKVSYSNSNSNTNTNNITDDDDDDKDSSIVVDEPFPDLKVSIVNEVISTGGTVSVNDIIQYGGTHLTPTEFHLALQNSYNPLTDSTQKRQQQKKQQQTILIDIRNSYEHNIGHFINPITNQPAINPETITFSSLDDTFLTKHITNWTSSTTKTTNTTGTKNPQKSINNENNIIDDENDINNDSTNIVQQHNEQQEEQEQQQPIVLLYCTGGIRCEKASVLLKKKYNLQNVYQLSGGIHRYIEQYGSNGYFHGVNFVFDQRGIQKPSDYNNNKHTCSTSIQSTTTTSSDTTTNDEKKNNIDNNITIDSITTRCQNDSSLTVVGRCIECSVPYETLCGSRVCTVCRDLVLVCNTCQQKMREYYCTKHQYLKLCYYTFLEVFTIVELQQQINILQTLYNTHYSIGNEYRNIRKTMTRQILKIQQHITGIENGTTIVNKNALRRCRTCMESSDICNGCCWGFWKKKLVSSLSSCRTENNCVIPVLNVGDIVEPGPHWNEIKLGSKYIGTTAAAAAAAAAIKNHNVLPPKLRRGEIVEVKTIWDVGGADVAVRWYNSNIDTKYDTNSNISTNNVDRNRVDNKPNGIATLSEIPISIVQQQDDNYKMEHNNVIHTSANDSTSSCTNNNDDKFIVTKKKNGTNYYPSIYRWGIIATNGQRRYDLVIVK